MKTNQKTVWWVLACASLITALLGYFSLRAVHEVNLAHKHWDNYLTKEKKLDATFSELQSVLGFGGFIHDFKNAVIRQDQDKYQSASGKLDRAFELLDAYETFDISAEEKAALVKIRQLLTTYRKKLGTIALHIIHAPDSEPYSVTQVDSLIRIDDISAIEAFRTLADAFKHRGDHQAAAIEDSNSSLLASIYNVGLVIPLVIAFSIGVVVFALKLSQYNRRVRDSRRFYNKLFESSPDAVLLVSSEGRITKANGIAAVLTGYSTQQLKQMSVEALLPEAYRHGHDALLKGFFSDPTRREMRGGRDLALRHKDGHEIPVDIGLNVLEVSGHRVAITSLRDVRSKRKAKQSLELSAAVFENISDAVLIADEHNKVVKVNKAFERITGFSADEVIGLNPGFAKSGRHNPEFYQRMHQDLQDKGEWQGEIWDRRKSGAVYPKWLTIKKVSSADTPYYIGIFSDITARKQAEDQLRHLAFHDPLTGLLNRNAFLERLDHAIHFSKHMQKMLGVLFIDLDYFKKINDSLGHPLGDKVLDKVADRLRNSILECDTVARLGGDEFIILIENVSETYVLEKVAHNVQKAISEPIAIQGMELHVTPSIGISVYPKDGETGTELIKNADAAMYQAKSGGRNEYHFFSEDLAEVAMYRLALEYEMRQAVERQEFELYYQPQIDCQTGAMVGAEALIRWNHPKRGMVSPLDFIPLAEETRLIIPIGQWVIHEACRQFTQWQKQGVILERIGINVAGPQMTHDDIAPVIDRALAQYSLDIQHLDLEITETFIMENSEQVLPLLQNMRSLGANLSIDDFGTGYSSLSQLKQLPIHKLKIDRAFVKDLPGSSDDVAITKAIISMAKSMNLKVIAEGVETQEQYAFLADLGCDEVQGYFFSKPLPADEFERLYSSHCQTVAKSDALNFII